MPYKKLLNQLIEQSGMTAKEIAERCEAEGASITPSYLSMLRKEDSGRNASDEVSVALARVFGKNEQLLVLERVIDDAPEELKIAIKNLALTAGLTLARASEQEITDEMYQSMKMLLEQQPLAEIVLSLQKPPDFSSYNKELFTQMSETPEGNVTVNVSGLQTFTATDDAMYPTIKKGDKVQIAVQPTYRTGEIIAFTVCGQEDILYRQMQKLNDQTLLLAFNSTYEPKAYDPEKMLVLGKAVSVSTLF